MLMFVAIVQASWRNEFELEKHLVDLYAHYVVRDKLYKYNNFGHICVSIRKFQSFQHK